MTDEDRKVHALMPFVGDSIESHRKERKSRARAARDLYITPQPLANAICQRLVELIPRPRRIMDPGCGPGAFMRAASLAWPGSEIFGIDIEQQHDDVGSVMPGCRYTGGYLTTPAETYGGPFDLIVGNPPYSIAVEFINQSLSLLRPRAFLINGGYLAFLLRLAFLGSQKRANTLWASAGFRWLIPIAERPSFTADGGSERMEYGVFVWHRDYQGRPEILPHLHWREGGR